MGLIKNKRAIKKEIRESEKLGLLPDVLLPNVKRMQDGTWDFSVASKTIATLNDFKKYEQENEEFYQIIKQNYPSIVSTIWKNAFSQLMGYETLSGKVLSGEVIDFDLVVSNLGFSHHDKINSMRYIVDKVNGVNVSFAKNPVTVKKIKRTKNDVLNLFRTDVAGYVLPEITENGVVVLPTKSKDLSCRFFAVADQEFTEEQVRDYLMQAIVSSNFNGNMSEIEEAVDYVVELARDAYSDLHLTSAHPENFLESCKRINSACSGLYYPDFSLIEERYGKKKTEKFVEEYFETEGLIEDSKQGEVVLTQPEKLSKLVVEGKVSSDFDVDEFGKLVLTITNKGGLFYEPFYEDDGKTLRVVPVQNEKE